MGVSLINRSPARQWEERAVERRVRRQEDEHDIVMRVQHCPTWQGGVVQGVSGRGSGDDRVVRRRRDRNHGHFWVLRCRERTGHKSGGGG